MKRAKFCGFLEIFRDKKLARRHAVPFYGFRIRVFIHPYLPGFGEIKRNPVICGVIEWESRYCEEKQARDLGLQIAKDLGIELRKKPRRFGINLIVV